MKIVAAPLGQAHQYGIIENRYYNCLSDLVYHFIPRRQGYHYVKYVDKECTKECVICEDNLKCVYPIGQYKGICRSKEYSLTTSKETEVQ